MPCCGFLPDSVEDSNNNNNGNSNYNNKSATTTNVPTYATPHHHQLAPKKSSLKSNPPIDDTAAMPTNNFVTTTISQHLRRKKEFEIDEIEVSLNGTNNILDDGVEPLDMDSASSEGDRSIKNSAEFHDFGNVQQTAPEAPHSQQMQRGNEYELASRETQQQPAATPSSPQPQQKKNIASRLSASQIAQVSSALVMDMSGKVRAIPKRKDTVNNTDSNNETASPTNTETPTSPNSKKFTSRRNRHIIDSQSILNSGRGTNSPRKGRRRPRPAPKAGSSTATTRSARKKVTDTAQKQQLLQRQLQTRLQQQSQPQSRPEPLTEPTNEPQPLQEPEPKPRSQTQSLQESETKPTTEQLPSQPQSLQEPQSKPEPEPQPKVQLKPRLPSLSPSPSRPKIIEFNHLSPPSTSPTTNTSTASQATRVSWKSDPVTSFSDWSVTVIHESDDDRGAFPTENDSRHSQPREDVYHLHRNILGFGVRKSFFLVHEFLKQKINPNLPSHTEISFVQSKAEVFPMVLDFLYYTNEVKQTLSAERACAVYTVAEALAIPELQKTIAEFYRKNLSLNNMGEFLASASRCDAKKLLLVSKAKIGSLLIERPERAGLVPPHFLASILNISQEHMHDLHTKEATKFTEEWMKSQSKHWSKAAAVCIVHNEGELNADLFEKLTNERTLPAIDFSVALKLILADDRQQNKNATPKNGSNAPVNISNLQKRCVESITDDWDKFQAVYPSSEAVSEALGHLPSNILADILVRSMSKPQSMKHQYHDDAELSAQLKSITLQPSDTPAQNSAAQRETTQSPSASSLDNDVDNGQVSKLLSNDAELATPDEVESTTTSHEEKNGEMPDVFQNSSDDSSNMNTSTEA